MPGHRPGARTAAADGATPPLQGLLAGLCLALGSGRAAEHRTALSGIADWPAVAGLATHHRVCTLLLQGLRNAGVRLPDAAAEQTLTEQRKRDTVRGMRQLDSMARVAAALADRGIRPLFLKGLPLGQRLYGSPFAKSSIDIDLLVPEGTYAAAAGVLRELGSRHQAPDARGTAARGHRHDDVEKHHVYLGLGARIELHRRLLGNPFVFDPPFDELDARALNVEIGSARFRTLGDADNLLFLACHGSVHYWQRLKWLCDFAGLLRTMDEASVGQAVARGRQEQLDDVLATALVLCRRDLRIELPASAAALRRDRLQVRFVVGLSRRAWTAPEGLRLLVCTAAMRVGRLFLRGGVRNSLEVRGLARRRNLSPDPPDRLLRLRALAQPAARAWRALRRGP